MTNDDRKTQEIEDVTLSIKGLIFALEGASANTDTDWRWKVASALRECPQWEAASIRVPARKA